MFTSILANIITEFFKAVFTFIPKSIKKYRFTRFFGKRAIESDKVFLVLDPYEHPSPRNKNPRFIKRFKGRKPDTPIIGEDKVLGSCSVRVTKYGSSEFGLYREKVNPIRTVLDEEILDNWEGTFICFGSSDSNIKTWDIEQLKENNLYEFAFNLSRNRIFMVMGDEYTINLEGDVGVLMRMKNPYNTEHYLFVCAGIGEWGTSGSAYYLFKNWAKLHKKFKNNENFVLLIRVKLNSDESARVIKEYKI